VLEFRILGPLEVERDGRPISIGAAKQRALLAILLLHANRVVSRDRLIDGLWASSRRPRRRRRSACSSLSFARRSSPSAGRATRPR